MSSISSSSLFSMDMYGLVYKSPPPSIPSFFKGEKRHFIPHLSKSICTACILSAGQHSLFFVGGGIRLLFFFPPLLFLSFQGYIKFPDIAKVAEPSLFSYFYFRSKNSISAVHPTLNPKYIFLLFLVLFVYFGKNLQRSSGFYCR